GFSDDRLKKSNELLQGIKLLKLYGWEDIYCKAIETARSKEVRQMLKAGMYMVATMLITQATPIIVTLVSFGVYSIVSPTPLTPEIAFSSLALFNQMMIPLFLLPMIIGQTVNAYVSTNRLQNFFIAPEIEDIEDGRVPLTKGSSADYRQLDNDNENIEPSDNMALYKNSENSALHHYVEDNDKTKLLDDGHPAAYGALGKTPALADNMVNDLPDDLAIKITNGNFAWDVANQNPTISGIDLEVQRGKLTMVIGLVGSGKSSLLSSMLGEMTTLSGRVQYNRSHSKVSYGAQKAWLMNASLRDNILFGEDYDHLRYQAVVKACALQPDIDILPAGDYTEIGEKGINLSGGQKQRVSVARCIYSHSDIVILDDPLSALDVHVGRQLFMEGEADGKLIEKEERERGSVSWKVYMVYARAMRIPIVCLLVSLLLAQVGASVATNFWLSEWSEAGANVTANRTELIYYISGYGGLAGLTILLALVYGLCNVIFALMAAKRLHLKLLHNVIHVPMRFYDTTPIGRILNRFSNDTQLIDQRLWQTFNALMRSSLNVLSALVVNTIVIPIFIVIVTPVMIGYYFLQRFFIATSRELQRLDSISKSPVFAHFSETLGGLSTIRAFRDEKRFRKQIVDRIDRNNIAYIYLQTANRWLGIRLDSIGASIVLIAGVACMASASLGALEPSYVGLSITYALQVSGYLNWVVRNSADAEMQMNAIERVDYYSNIPTEQYEGVYKPPKDWPKNGDISIEHISVRYAEDLDPVLHNVSVHFKPGEKVGICGRTGSGKSSLTLALFRVIDMFQGRILIDNVDISHVPLITLRNRIAIIPQDPILFAGTIRHNLDPEDTRTDDELWEALEIAQMKKVVSELDNTL
uniref:ATP-binding cassette sub-family C member 9-like n=1 Tax=Saccoglossus kowalevskii TaxID=10224 RepID=A0ABM0N098_SACKO